MSNGALPIQPPLLMIMETGGGRLPTGGGAVSTDPGAGRCVGLRRATLGRMPTRVESAALRRHLRENHDVVTRADLASLGLYADYARRQVDAGRWQRVHDGIFCAHTGPLTFHQRCAALALTGGVLDGPTALALHGLDGFDDGSVHVTVAHGASIRRAPGVVVRQSVVLTERSVRPRAGLRAVRPEWAALTVARSAPWRARAVLAATVQQGLARADHVEACVLAVGRFRGRPAVVDALRDVSGGSRSELEARFLDACRGAGLPAPERHVPVDAGGRRAWLDACWPWARLAVEVDGKAYHVLGEDWENDLARQNALVLAGFTVLRFGALAIRTSPARVAEDVRRALATARSRVTAAG